MSTISDILSATQQAQKEMVEVALDAWRAHVLDLTEDIPEPQNFFSVKGIGCIPRGELIGIKGKAKVGKSQLIYYLMGLMLGGRSDGDVRASLLARILIADTEQSKGSLAKCLRRGLRFAGLAENANNDRLLPLYLKPLDAGERRKVIRDAAEAFRPDIIVIDGIRDLMANFNDLDESSALIKYLQDLTADLGCAVVCVLHENKGKDDSNMRGHLGTELLNKLYDCYEVSKNDGRFVVKCTESRGRDIPEWAFIINEGATSRRVTSRPSRPSSRRKRPP